MESPSLVLLSRQQALQRAMDVIANNVANSNTTGFKAERVLFENFLVEPNQETAINFVYDKAMYRDTTQGAMAKTGNDLDVAINGDGYFAVNTDKGTRYTRSGSFMLNEQGEIVTANGERIAGEGGQVLVIPREANEVRIASDGTVSTNVGQVGRLEVLRFQNEQSLQEVGNGLYTSRETPTPAGSSATLAQGMIERSNISPVQEMTRMMEITRAYQQTQRMMDQEHERIRNAIQKLGRVG
jgi:flagellar basal-body rod protein FlgF